MENRVMAAQITRGADLTEEDLRLIAEDALVVCGFCMRHHVKRDPWLEQGHQAVRVRLGRRPLVQHD